MQQQLVEVQRNAEVERESALAAASEASQSLQAIIDAQKNQIV